MEQTKRYKKGFILGKFLPPHQGHVYLIQSAMKQVEELTVLVCTVQKEPIPGILRYQWMKELIPDAKIIHVSDEVPSYPHEHPDFWEIWTQLLKRVIDIETEIFFSSENYGDEVAKRLGIKHILIDLERQAVPISASAIRRDPIANWNFIPDNVKPYFVKRIVLTGPESTGKTTMARLLAEYYKTIWVEEYGREYFVNKGTKLILEDIGEIAKGQIKKEDEGVLKANKFLFCDTDLIVTQIWSEIYFKACPKEVVEHSQERKCDLYLLMDIDMPWEDDGTREFPHLREWHFKRIKDELEIRGLNYLVVFGNYEERLKTCITFINKNFF